MRSIHARYQAALLFASGVIVGLLLSRTEPQAHAEDSAPVADVVRARQFDLISPEGKRAASLLCWPKQGGHLTFYGSDGKQRVDLGLVFGDEPQLYVQDGAGNEVLRFQVDPKRRPKMTFSERGIPRVNIGIGSLGHAVLGLSGVSRFPEATFAVTAEGVATLDVIDKTGHKLWEAPIPAPKAEER